MERKRNGAINLLVMLVIGVSTFAVAQYANSLSGHVAVGFFGLGLLAAGGGWVLKGPWGGGGVGEVEVLGILGGGGRGDVVWGEDLGKVFPRRFGGGIQ